MNLNVFHSTLEATMLLITYMTVWKYLKQVRKAVSTQQDVCSMNKYSESLPVHKQLTSFGVFVYLASAF
jgi:hypothetical protein